MSNKDKNIHGLNFRNAIKKELQYYLDSFEIKLFQSQQYLGYKNNFYIDFLIIFDDNKKWLIYSSTSLRTDRMKISEWNAHNVLNLIDNIEEVIYLYPDKLSDSDLKSVNKIREKYMAPEYITPFTDIFSLSKLKLRIEKKFLMSTDKTGSFLAKRGLSFEKEIVKIMNSRENLDLLYGRSKNETGLDFNLFKSIIENSDVDYKNSDIVRIEASSDIPRLRSRGAPKTDVVVNVYYDEKMVQRTFNIKKTHKKSVTVHEYSYEKFIDALNITDERFNQALYDLQCYGGSKALKDKCKDSFEYLNQNFKHYNEALIKWVFSGLGGPILDSVQIASHIIIYDVDVGKCLVLSEDTLTKLLLEKKMGQFSTPFTYTYPSKKKGKAIQLKCNIKKLTT